MRESIGKIPSRFQNLHHAGHSIGEEEDVSFFDRMDAAVLLGIGTPVSVSRLCLGAVEGPRDVNNIFSRKGGDGWMGRDGSIGDDLNEGEH